MKLSRSRRNRAAYTLVEVMMASGLGVLVVGMLASFALIAARTTAGIVKQSVINTQAGYSCQYIFQRSRYATSVQVAKSGNLLIMGFDDNYQVDSNNDGITYNDRNHFESLEFVDGDTNVATLADNKLLYKANTNSTQTQTVLAYGMTRLPNTPVFAISNATTVLVNFSLKDSFVSDGYQECDVRSIFVPRNRPQTTNTITILPDI